MTVQTSPSYLDRGAVVEAGRLRNYRDGITIDDPVGLQTPIKLRPTDSMQQIEASVRFLGASDQCDLTLVAWKTARDGSQIAMGVSDPVMISAGAFRETEVGGAYVGQTEPFDTQGAGLYELRVSNLTGEIDNITTWAH